ncbi:head GIN domain-containing protein [Seonamhaeicola aphaedonensis]|uniref:Putative autotransporter adhesin-like protein n=1 Tax=Seonamhaeicola aphaedonensis TaxID=1461338 RepID=A0A3D9HD85_9FLAO|nr:head GIN domain-containing protein [Seonamhaeicola aphaedonensis]RED47447.1 putative autotransporter adhesin-like protein [Seonamhaeicola aphaedonensis]
MTTLLKIIVTAILSLSLVSCNFDINFSTGVKGNGNVITEDRFLSESFSTIKANEGLNVYLTQGNEEKIAVEADENLHDIIVTEIEDGVLKIHTKQNIGKASAKKVHVSFKDITSIISTSGSDVYSTNTLSADELTLKTTSGSDMELDVNTFYLNCKSTSGSDLKLSGKTKTLDAEANSGSDIKAGNLKAESSIVKASSGADITINTSKELIAKVSSGGDIKYYGDPEIVNKSDNVSGSIKKLN